ncbi:sensor histidine kinase [Lyngbya confervoides]|uniref:histidine kinase n=1 Tax=Lyngbya confervoides BDU141951 TaxID=1574623 RepID=A0ABD4SZ04_9CYAN|nr:ATP-binding protein [Lyngbya confervoides]MCM1981575.1 ATP-binding protein [Lyngbya confervoides BDU141951]
MSARSAEEWVDHTEIIIFKSNDLILSVTTLESRVRQLAILGRSPNLDQIQSTRQEVLAFSKVISREVQGNPAQQQRWQQVRQLTEIRLQLLETLAQELQVPIQESDRFAELAPLLAEGESAMAALRDAVSTFQREELMLLEIRQARLDQISQASNIIGWSLLIGSLASSFGAVYLFWVLDFERTEQDLQLSESQQLTQAIAASVVDGVIILNGLGEVETFNESALQMFGYQAHEVEGRPLKDFLEATPERPKPGGSPAANRRVLKTYGLRKSGETFTAAASCSLVKPNQQQLIIVRDITDQDLANKRLEGYARDLEQLNLALTTSNSALIERNQELDQFVYVAAHDLRSPLRAINSLSEWIEEDLSEILPETNRQQFHLLRSRVERMGALINGLASYAQIGRIKQRREPVEVGKLLTQIIRQQNYPADYSIVVHLPMPTLLAHAPYLEQVFTHLIDNAIKFHHQESGNITIRCQELPQSWEFLVIDDGPGIDPAFHDKVFQVLQTLQSRDEMESTGIGLAIVSKILTTVGGEVAIESTPGAGTTVRFLWPKASPREEDLPKGR